MRSVPRAGITTTPSRRTSPRPTRNTNATVTRPVLGGRVAARIRRLRLRQPHARRQHDENGVPCLPTAACTAARRTAATVHERAPKLSLRWEPRPGLVLYANASRGFRPPEMTELYRLQRDQSVAALDSEQVDALELGTRRRSATGMSRWPRSTWTRGPDPAGVEWLLRGQWAHFAPGRRVPGRLAGDADAERVGRRHLSRGTATSFRVRSKAARTSCAAMTSTPLLATCCGERCSGDRPIGSRPRPSG